MKMVKRKTTKKSAGVDSLTHIDENRVNIPTAEDEALVRPEDAQPYKAKYKRTNRPSADNQMYPRDVENDPQLVWRGKDKEDLSSLAVDVMPIYVQEKIDPKVIINSLKAQTQRKETTGKDAPASLFQTYWDKDINKEDDIDFYKHAERWSNRMILGDSLKVMASLSSKEGLSGQVQCIYMDPPYGIKFKSNWQPKTNSRNFGEKELPREPEPIRAFRDTWADNEHSYLSYLRDRLTVARDLLTDSGSMFLQISEENLHLTRSVMDEVFGKDNFVSQIYFSTSSGFPSSKTLTRVGDYVLWFCKNKDSIKVRSLYLEKSGSEDLGSAYAHIQSQNLSIRHLTTSERKSGIELEGKVFTLSDICGEGKSKTDTPLEFQGKTYWPNSTGHWKAGYPDGMERLRRSNRISVSGKTLRYVRFLDDFPLRYMTNVWLDTGKAGFASDKAYVVETAPLVVRRCILMSTDPGDLVLDPTCGSGTTASVAEHWGRRWITIDTSRVSLTLARAKLLGNRYPYFLLSDSKEGNIEEAKLSGNTPDLKNSFSNSVTSGFVYKRIPHIKLKSIANNIEIDEIWNRCQPKMETLRKLLNKKTENSFNEWSIPLNPDEAWCVESVKLHKEWIEARLAFQKEIDMSIAKNAEVKLLYDQPTTNNNIVRVTGPFTVESLSPHRIIPTDFNDADISKSPDIPANEAMHQNQGRVRPESEERHEARFLEIISENLKNSGVENTKKDERMTFTALETWPGGRHIQFLGRYLENNHEKKAAICIGPEYGTVAKSLITGAAREAADFFDIVVVAGFAFEAYSSNDSVISIGKMRVLRARMNNDLHMADRLKSGASGNIFVCLGDPDIALSETKDGRYVVEIKGIDIFDPTTGKIKSSECSKAEVACWFIDTDYNNEAFFVRHAYFCDGGPDPFKRLKVSLRSEINEEAWASINSTVSRPFMKPSTGRIAVKAINIFGDEVLSVLNI